MNSFFGLLPRENRLLTSVLWFVRLGVEKSCARSGCFCLANGELGSKSCNPSESSPEIETPKTEEPHTISMRVQILARVRRAARSVLLHSLSHARENLASLDRKTATQPVDETGKAEGVHYSFQLNFSVLLSFEQRLHPTRNRGMRGPKSSCLSAPLKT